MAHWLDTLWHRLQGHIAVTVTQKHQFYTGLPFSGWATSVTNESMHIVIDRVDGEELTYNTALVDFTVTA